MKKTFLLLSFLAISLSGLSQEIVFVKNIELKSILKDKRETYPIENANKDELGVFLLDNKSINALLFDNDFKLMQTHKVERPKDLKFTTLLGASITDNTYHLMFTSSIKKQFWIKSINMLNGESSENLLPLKLKNEKFIETVTYNNKLYLFSIKKASSVLKLHIIEGDKIINTKEWDCSQYKFSYDDKPSLYHAIGDGTIKSKFDVIKVESDNPNPIDMTYKYTKLYNIDEKVHLCLDRVKPVTNVISINLNDLSLNVDTYRHGNHGSCNLRNKFTRTNSYLFMDHLFQISSCIEGLYVHIYNMADKKQVKFYSVGKDEEITFKNTPLYQKGGMYHFSEKERVLKKTKQVLRKIADSKVGISVYEHNDKLEVTIGSYDLIERNIGGFGVGFGSSSVPMSNVSTIKVPVYHYNPTTYGYFSYTDTKSVYFKSLFSPVNFEHIDGEVKKNVFDMIKEFKDDSVNKLFSTSVFKKGDDYYFAYYERTEKKYYIRKFND